MIGQPIPPSVIADPRELRYVREVAAAPAKVVAPFTVTSVLETGRSPTA